MKNAHNHLQKLAVGLEQIVIDQQNFEGQFKHEFLDAEFRLKSVYSNTIVLISFQF